MALGVAAAAITAIVSTYRVFNNMYDEPATLAAGMEWLSKGTYTYEPQHPPLARIAGALGPYLVGERGTGNSHMYEEGRQILGQGAHYARILTLARIGELPFFAVALWVVWAWVRRLTDERGAALAVFLTAANPNLLAHAGVAGIDMAVGAMMPAALYAFVHWLERPNVRRGAIFGALFALCGLTKFSGIAYLIPSMLITVLFARAETSALRSRSAARSVAVALVIAAAITWAMYRFSFSRVPAPEFWAGLAAFLRHGTSGHPAYLFGQVRTGGWWYYDLVVFLVKTPIPLMIFGAIGAWVAFRQLRNRRAVPAENETAAASSVAAAAEYGKAAEYGQAAEYIAPLMGVLSVLLIACLTPVDLGVRLILPLYPLLAILAALGALHVWQRLRQSSTRFLVAALLAWAALDPAVTHPDYIAYFNIFAGPEPERVLVDSNLDWGQDLYRLRDAVKDLHMDSLRVHYFGTAAFWAVGLDRTRRLRPFERATGWVAASETFYAGVWADSALAWLHAYQPVARVGRSIRLYYIKP